MSNKKDKQLEAEKKNSIPQSQSKLAKDLLKIIAISDVRLGDRLSVDEEKAKYKEATLKMMRLMFDKNVDLLEVEIIFQLMKQAIVIFEGTVMGSLEISTNQALKKFWGKHPDELKMQDIENKLKSDK